MGIKEIIPLLAAIIGLTPVILNWFNERSAEQAKRKTIDRAKLQVEFLEAWLKAQREVTSDERYDQVKNEVSERLDALLQKTIETDESEQEKSSNEESHFFLQKWFLLYMPHTPPGWIFHTLFYITISFAAMFLFGSSLPTDDINADPSWEYFKSDLGFIIPAFLFFMLVALVFQRLARQSERRYLKRIKTQEN